MRSKVWINLGYSLAVMIVGILGLYLIYKINRGNFKNAPKINYQNPLSVIVQEISFERNELILNDTLYNAGGITWFSRIVENEQNITRLMDISPPFKMRKARINDTLYISTGNKVYFLLVTPEQAFARSMR